MLIVTSYIIATALRYAVDDWTPLHQAVWNKQPDALAILIDAQADIDA